MIVLMNNVIQFMTVELETAANNLLNVFCVRLLAVSIRAGN